MNFFEKEGNIAILNNFQDFLTAKAHNIAKGEANANSARRAQRVDYKDLDFQIRLLYCVLGISRKLNFIFI
jgi:23S rRNA maturation mini-RNase III